MLNGTAVYGGATRDIHLSVIDIQNGEVQGGCQRGRERNEGNIAGTLAGERTKKGAATGYTLTS